MLIFFLFFSFKQKRFYFSNCMKPLERVEKIIEIKVLMLNRILINIKIDLDIFNKHNCFAQKSTISKNYSAFHALHFTSI